MPEITAAIAARAAFLLTEETGTGNQEISKYGGAQALIRALDPALLRNNGASGSRETRVIDVCSVSGGSGKTLAALYTARRLAEMGRKVLYVNAQSFQDFYSLLPEEDARSYMSPQLLRSMTDLPETAADTALQEVVHGTFDYVPQAEKMLSSYQIRDVNYIALTEEIRARQIYDYILLEADTEMSSALMMHLMQSERLLITSLQSRDAAGRLDRFTELLGQGTAQGVIVCGRYRAHLPDDLKRSAAAGTYPVCEYIPENEGGDMLQDLLSSGVFRQTAEAIM